MGLRCCLLKQARMPSCLRTAIPRFVEALAHTSTKVIYVGGADSYRAIEDVLQDGCTGVQLGRPLIREPFFVRRIEAALADVEDIGASASHFDIDSKCIRCNQCTLASI